MSIGNKSLLWRKVACCIKMHHKMNLTSDSCKTKSKQYISNTQKIILSLSKLTNRIGIPRNTPDNTTPSPLGLGHIIHQQIDQQKMSKVIDPHGLLEPVVRPRRFRIGGLVDGRVADEVVHGTDGLEQFEVVYEIADGSEAAQFQFHHDVGIVRHAHLL
jgi:hypothetical protein